MSVKADRIGFEELNTCTIEYWIKLAQFQLQLGTLNDTPETTIFSSNNGACRKTYGGATNVSIILHLKTGLGGAFFRLTAEFFPCYT